MVAERAITLSVDDFQKLRDAQRAAEALTLTLATVRNRAIEADEPARCSCGEQAVLHNDGLSAFVRCPGCGSTGTRVAPLSAYVAVREWNRRHVIMAVTPEIVEQWQKEVAAVNAKVAIVINNVAGGMGVSRRVFRCGVDDQMPGLQYTRERGFRVACTCGACGPWKADPDDAELSWNDLMGGK